MKAIVTGANGFVGSALVKKLVNEGFDVLALDIPFGMERIDKTNPHITYRPFYMENIFTLHKYVAIGEYDYFFHFAWNGSAGDLRSDIEAQQVNVNSTINALREAKKIGCKRFIAAGSIMEFEAMITMQKEGSVPPASMVYSVAKLNAHYLAKIVANEEGIDLLWAYITNAYGPKETSMRFINSTLAKIIDGKPLEFTSATQNYDFVYIDDVANAFYTIATKGEKNHSYLIGSGNAKPLKEFICDIVNSINPEVVPHFGSVSFEGISLPLSYYDASALFSLGYKLTVPFAEGIKKAYEWTKELLEINKKKEDKDGKFQYFR